MNRLAAAVLAMGLQGCADPNTAYVISSAVISAAATTYIADEFGIIDKPLRRETPVRVEVTVISPQDDITINVNVDGVTTNE